MFEVISREMIVIGVHTDTMTKTSGTMLSTGKALSESHGTRLSESRGTHNLFGF